MTEVKDPNLDFNIGELLIFCVFKKEFKNYIDTDYVASNKAFTADLSPSQTTIFSHLHLLYEDLRLDKYEFQTRKELANILINFVKCSGPEKVGYIRHYNSDFGFQISET